MRHGVTLVEGQRCRKCGGPVHLSTYINDGIEFGFDARFCRACDLWLESACTDEDCEHCQGRPAAPSLIESHDEADEEDPYRGLGRNAYDHEMRLLNEAARALDMERELAEAKLETIATPADRFERAAVRRRSRSGSR